MPQKQSEPLMHEVKIKELNFPDTLNIWWDFLWRGLIMGVASTLAGGILGAIFGFIAGIIVTLAGGSLDTVGGISEIGGGILGLIAGAFFFYVYLCWLLKSKLGGYRLALVKVDDEQHSTTE